jgi:hypothetical protein
LIKHSMPWFRSFTLSAIKSRTPICSQQFVRPQFIWLRAGVFVFDCWYGPAVLSCRPEVRVKRCENSQLKVFRVAEPTMYPERNIVDVNYTAWVEQKSTGEIKRASPNCIR